WVTEVGSVERQRRSSRGSKRNGRRVETRFRNIVCSPCKYHIWRVAGWPWIRIGAGDRERTRSSSAQGLGWLVLLIRSPFAWGGRPLDFEPPIPSRRGVLRGSSCRRTAHRPPPSSSDERCCRR